MVALVTTVNVIIAIVVTALRIIVRVRSVLVQNVIVVNN